MNKRTIPDPYERERRLVEVRGMDRESASGLTGEGGGVRSGEYEAHRSHFGSGYWWEGLPEGCYNEAGSKCTYPDDQPKQFRYRLGWYKAGSRERREGLGSDEARAGWDAFHRKYPHLTRGDDE